jgi:hypothetical protein
MATAASHLPDGRVRGRDLARGLGWFSLALGAAEVMAPRRLGKAVGVGEHPRLVQACGLRELVAGGGLLSSSDQRPWIWSRIAGDAIDLAALAPALSRHNPRRSAACAAFGAVAAVTALDVLCARRLDQERAGEWRPKGPPRDYSDRSGFPSPPEAMRGKARHLAGAA